MEDPERSDGLSSRRRLPHRRTLIGGVDLRETWKEQRRDAGRLDARGREEGTDPRDGRTDDATDHSGAADVTPHEFQLDCRGLRSATATREVAAHSVTRLSTTRLA